MTEKNSHDRAYVTVREICDDLRIHPNTVYRMIERGELTALRVGERIFRIPAADYADYKHRLWQAAEEYASLASDDSYPVIDGQTEIEVDG